MPKINQTNELKAMAILESVCSDLLTFADMILVTGGTGFLGAHLLVELTNQDIPVRAILRNHSSTSYVEKVFKLFSTDPDKNFKKIEWIEADLLDIFKLEDALNGITQVYHCAGMVSFTPKEREMMMAINAKGTANLVNLCLEKKDIRLCHVSSIAAIGRSRLDETIAEDRFWKNDPNNSWYAISKYHAEREVWRGIEEGLNAVIINPSVIMGYCNWDEGTGRMFSRVWEGLNYYTDGVTGWVDVKDVVHSMLYLMNTDIKGERYIISSENLPYRQVFDWIAEALHKPRPAKKAGPLLSKIAWRIEKIRTGLTGRNPLITKETATTAQLKCYYDNSKYTKLNTYTFLPIKESIQQTASLFLSEKN